MKALKNWKQLIIVLVIAVAIPGCQSCKEEVKQGKLGRVKTPDGWGDKVLLPGYWTCWWNDEMFLVDATEKINIETMKILVGGKVNLSLEVQVRSGIDLGSPETALGVFEKVEADESGLITHKSLYDMYLKLKVNSVPRDIIGSMEDIQTVVADRPAILKGVQAAIMLSAKETPLKVTAIEITNWDWPDSITEAQEELAQIQLGEEKEAAKVRAELKKAEGQLEVETAKVLIEVKKAEGLAKSIDIIKDALKDCPEYLQWHTVRVLGEAASGPNNAFFVFPYDMPGAERSSMLANAHLKQMLEQDARLPGAASVEGEVVVPTPAEK